MTQQTSLVWRTADISNTVDLNLLNATTIGSSPIVRQDNVSLLHNSRDHCDNVYAVGHTTDSEESNAKATLFKLGSNGRSLWNTKFSHSTEGEYLNGSNYARMSVVDSCGNVYVAGETLDQTKTENIVDLPTQKLFITKYSPNGCRLWSQIIWSNNNPDNPNSSHHHNFVKMLIIKNQLFVVCSAQLDDQYDVSENTQFVEDQLYVTHYLNNNNSQVSNLIQLKRSNIDGVIYQQVSYIVKLTDLDKTKPIVSAKQIFVTLGDIDNYNLLAMDATANHNQMYDCHENEHEDKYVYVSGVLHTEYSADPDLSDQQYNSFLKKYDRSNLADIDQYVTDIYNCNRVDVLAGKKVWNIIYYTEEEVNKVRIIRLDQDTLTEDTNQIQISPDNLVSDIYPLNNDQKQSILDKFDNLYLTTVTQGVNKNTVLTVYRYTMLDTQASAKTINILYEPSIEDENAVFVAPNLQLLLNKCNYLQLVASTNYSSCSSNTPKPIAPIVFTYDTFNTLNLVNDYTYKTLVSGQSIESNSMNSILTKCGDVVVVGLTFVKDNMPFQISSFLFRVDYTGDNKCYEADEKSSCTDSTSKSDCESESKSESKCDSESKSESKYDSQSDTESKNPDDSYCSDDTSSDCEEPGFIDRIIWVFVRSISLATLPMHIFKFLMLSIACVSRIIFNCPGDSRRKHKNKRKHKKSHEKKYKTITTKHKHHDKHHNEHDFDEKCEDIKTDDLSIGPDTDSELDNSKDCKKC